MATEVVTVQFDEARLRSIAQTLKGVKKGMPRVMSRAINKTATGLRTTISKALAKELQFKVGTVRKSIGLAKATQKIWRAQLDLFGNRIPLYNFGAKPRKPRQAGDPAGTGITYKIRQRKTLAHAFTQRMKSGHVGIFSRLGRKKQITELFGPSLGQVLAKDDARMVRLTESSASKLEKNIDIQVGLILAKA